jgi:hypothetical protein
VLLPRHIMYGMTISHMMRAVPTTMMGIQPIWGARGCTGGSSERLHRPRISHEARSICACAGWSTGAYLCEPERSTPQSDHVAGFRVARPGLSISAATDAERPHRRYHNTYHPSQRGLCAPRPPHGRCNQIQGCRALVSDELHVAVRTVHDSARAV